MHILKYVKKYIKVSEIYLLRRVDDLYLVYQTDSNACRNSLVCSKIYLHASAYTITISLSSFNKRTIPPVMFTTMRLIFRRLYINLLSHDDCNF